MQTPTAPRVHARTRPLHHPIRTECRRDAHLLEKGQRQWPTPYPRWSGGSTKAVRRQARAAQIQALWIWWTQNTQKDARCAHGSGNTPMNIIVLLLSLGQSLSTNKWPCHMEAPLVCTIHGANLIIHIMPLAPFGPFAIPNENIRQCPRGQWTNPNDVPNTINGNRYFRYTTSIFWIEEDITKDASYGSDGHIVRVMCDKIRKVWDVVPLRQSFRPSNFFFFFFFLTDSRSSKSTQDCAWESGRLQHMIQWIPAKRGTWQRPRVHMRITEGSLLR